jgi:hypothetical protein
MRGLDDSEPRNQTDPDAIKTPRCTLTEAEFQQLRARYEEIFQENEEDPKQQDFYEARSGPGRTTFHPADRPTKPDLVAIRKPSGETQSKYTPPPAETVLSACRTAIELHQTIHSIDPQQMRISYSMYFDLSQSVASIHHKPFQGRLSFVGIAYDTRYVDVRVYNDISTNDVICIH